MVTVAMEIELKAHSVQYREINFIIYFVLLLIKFSVQRQKTDPAIIFYNTIIIIIIMPIFILCLINTREY